MKKACIIFTCLIVFAVLLTACADAGAVPVDCSDPQIFCIGLVTDVGRIKDNPSNQAVLAAVQQAQNDLGAKIGHIETAEAIDYPKNISYFTAAGYDVVVTAGAPLSKATAAAAAKHPDIKFIGIDQVQDPAQPRPSNLVNVVLPRHYLFGTLVSRATKSKELSPDQVGFLVGAIAARTTRSHKIGAICMPEKTPMAQALCDGYKAGAAFISPKMRVNISDTDIISVNINTLEKRTAVADMIEKGFDVIFGPANEEVVSEAARKGIYALGVRSDEEFTLPQVQQMFSGPRPITLVLFEIFKQAKSGELPDSFDYVNEETDYAPFQDLIAQLPQKLKSEIGEIQNSLLDGSLKTNVVIPKPTIPPPTPQPQP